MFVFSYCSNPYMCYASKYKQCLLNWQNKKRVFPLSAIFSFQTPKKTLCKGHLHTRRARNFINMAYFRKKDACFFILSPHGEKYMACRKKHKAHILKYKPYILKYMPYIFENLKHMIHNNLHSSSIFLSSF